MSLPYPSLTFTPFDILTAAELNEMRANEDYLYDGLSVASPTGIIVPFGGSSAPTGWLIADGDDISRSTYASLFSVIGTAYGEGDGSTTFNLPDLRGKVSLGSGTSVLASVIASADVSSGADTFTSLTDHKFSTGTKAVFSTSSSAPGGLTPGSTYYVIVVSATVFKLASSYSAAIAGSAINISSSGSGNQTFTSTSSTFTLGAIGGEESHVQVEGEVAFHKHFIGDAFKRVGAGSTGFGPVINAGLTSAADQPYETTSEPSGGYGGAMNIMQPYLTVNHIIKT
jgi:microcystin-dependent protein